MALTSVAPPGLTTAAAHLHMRLAPQATHFCPAGASASNANPLNRERHERRYCGHCWYNLHGIDLSVCPECGRQLAGEQVFAGKDSRLGGCEKGFSHQFV